MTCGVFGLQTTKKKDDRRLTAKQKKIFFPCPDCRIRSERGLNPSRANKFSTFRIESTLRIEVTPRKPFSGTLGLFLETPYKTQKTNEQSSAFVRATL
jgi:hypothetical protein